MTLIKQKNATIAIALISIISVVAAFSVDPIAQDLNYHVFADQRTLLTTLNFWNVASNLPFLIVGLMGLLSVLGSHKLNTISELKSAYAVFFFGVSLVAFGSGYYHLWPSNNSLVWDRLPMTIAFMALFAIIIGEFISLRTGKLLLIPFIIIGAFSVYYWHITESAGEGDLRLYALVQFLPIILIPVILILFKSKSTNTAGYWWLLGAYVLAKGLEFFDAQIYDSLIFISGHSLKHIAAALGIYLLLRAYQKTYKN